MKLWIDAQLSPVLAQWLNRELGVEAVAVRDLGLRDAKDAEIFQRAKESEAIVMTKDSDFLLLMMSPRKISKLPVMRDGTTG